MYFQYLVISTYIVKFVSNIVNTIVTIAFHYRVNEISKCFLPVQHT